MLDSTPVKTSQPHSSRRRRPPVPWWRREGMWLTGSIILHVVGVLVIWLTPVRGMIFQERDPRDFEVTARAERVEEMVEYLRQREADIIVEQYMEELFNIEDELHDILDWEQEQFDELAADLAQDAATRALEAQEKALKAQADALTAEDEVLAKVGDEAKAAHQRARDAQGGAGEAQRTGTQALAFASEHFDPAKAAQQKANEAQQRASETQGKVSELQEWAPGVYNAVRQEADKAAQAQQKIAPVEQEVTRDQAGVDKTRKAFEQATAKQGEAKASADSANEQSQAARRAADAAKAQARRTKDAGDQAKVAPAEAAAKSAASKASAAKRQAEQVKRAAQQAERSKRSAEDKLRRTQQKLEQTKRLAANAANRSADARKRHEETNARVADVQGQAKALQADARKAQADARDVLVKAIASAPADATATVASSATADAPQVRPRPNLAGKNIAELYEQAMVAEDQIAETYRHVHATEVATVRNVPVADALAETVVAKTARPEFDRKLLEGKVQSVTAATAHRAEIGKVKAEVASMVDAAQRLLDRARSGEGQGQGTALSLAGMRAITAQNRALDELAREDESQRHKDLAAAMKGTTPAAPKGVGANKPAGGSGKKAGSPRYDPFPQAGRDPKNVVPGRVVTVRGAQPRVFVRNEKTKTSKWIDAKWMFVDSWYTIGPFPNPGRKNIDTHFPPQSVVDLDAVYTGKGGRKVGWQFMNAIRPSAAPMNDQPYGIYYAYTELWFEEAMDLVIAVGSDDNSRIWIEGKQVWLSGRNLKSWRGDEGYRTVHFKKGINRVLYRVENGWRETRFSMMICLQRHARPKPE